MPEQDFIVIPEESPVSIGLEPAQSAIHSLLILVKSDHASGFGDWVVQTANALTPEEAERHRLVLIGFFHAVLPERSWPSFPAYLEHLADLDPVDLRDKLLDAYALMQPKCGLEEGSQEPPSANWDDVLKDAASYVGFLRERFGEPYVDAELETTAYAYVIDPPALHDLIVSHLRWMWQQYLAPEWQRTQPVLRSAVHACQQVEMEGLTFVQAAERITGQELADEKWQHSLRNVERLVLVPTPHAGPYLGRLRAGKTLWILFGPRLPEGVQIDAPDLSRAEIIMRLGALADDNRLQILKLVSDQGELTSKELMSSLGLSQSATSRHLKQLSATGYLAERRCNGAKCYKLNPERLQGTLAAVAGYLLGEHQT